MSTNVTDPAATQQLVMFSLDDEDYGIAITRVQEIIRHTPPRPIPGSAPGMEGVINLRGRLIPVVDLRARLGMGGVAPEGAKVVITELEETTVGMVVDDVREVITIDLSTTEPAPESVVGADSGAIESVAKVGDRLLVILDPVRLLG
jgi:purine-binding chemotaxis protein CheW